MTHESSIRIGVVAIGRNEGDRLKRCLHSLQNHPCVIVYVDSGSTDESVPFAHSLQVEVVSLDMTQPFTAARARNAGLKQLLADHPDLQYVQFVDGDCEINSHWLDRASKALDDNPRAAVVCGRRRERAPEASIYNRLCDLEWDTPIGRAAACGGDSLMRVSALKQVEGFDPTLIAGEEPELCYRLRQHQWEVWRLDAEMTLHDAAVFRFSQWWKRTVRSGHAYAEGAWMYGRSPERYCLRPVRSFLFWALFVPLVAIGLAWWTWGLSLLLLLGYPVLVLRIARRQRRLGRSPDEAKLYARFIVIGKFAELAGALRFLRTRLTGRKSTLIEYKGAGNIAPGQSNAS